MFWIALLGIISLLLVLAGSAGVLLTVRKYRRRSAETRAKALVEMMKIQLEAEDEEEQG
jgi:hypothetical protein